MLPIGSVRMVMAASVSRQRRRAIHRKMDPEPALRVEQLRIKANRSKREGIDFQSVSKDSAAGMVIHPIEPIVLV
jgi:hypothetical protein